MLTKNKDERILPPKKEDIEHVDLIEEVFAAPLQLFLAWA